MRTLLALFIITISLVVSCGGGSGKSSTDEGKSSMDQEQVSPITFANDKLVSIDHSILQGFEDEVRKTTGYDLDISTSPDTASYQTVIKQSIRDKSAPGFFTWWSGSQLQTLAKEGLIEDVTHIWDKYLIPQGVSADLKEALSYEGKVYATPYSVLYNVVFYNKKAFEMAGITSEPTTFNEFLEVCDKLQSIGVTPIGLKNDGWAGFIWFQQMLCVEDPQLYLDICDGTKKYTDPEVVDAMYRWKEMLDNGYFSKPQSLLDWRKNLAVGNIGMMLEPTPEITVFNRDYALVSGEDFGTFVVPSGTMKKGTVFFEVSPQCISTASASRNDALKALENWYNPELQTYIYENFGHANTSTVTVSDPVFNEILDYTADSDNYVLLLRYYENTPEEIRNIALDQFMKFQLGNVGVEEMLQTIQVKADEVFGR